MNFSWKVLPVDFCRLRYNSEGDLWCNFTSRVHAEESLGVGLSMGFHQELLKVLFLTVMLNSSFSLMIGSIYNVTLVMVDLLFVLFYFNTYKSPLKLK